MRPNNQGLRRNAARLLALEVDAPGVGDVELAVSEEG